ncbi:TPA: leucine--tRNA ligase, partial [Patescibacteria group bacterium]|nr:leucine--tRNA ligase [Patescibacteria group bacterium]
LPETIFGATYLVVAPEHSLIETLADKIENIDEVRAYAQTAKDKEELERIAEGKEKTGVELKGIRAINPATKEDIPVWVADYVLGGYGTGAIMAVPAHDERDNEFAKKFGLEIRQVVAPRVVDPVNPPREDAKNTDRNMLHAIVMHPTEDKILSLKWKTHPWQTFITGGIEDGEDVLEAAKREVFEETGYKNMEVIKLMPYIMRAEFYAAHKEVNRKVNANVVMLKLTDLAQEVVSAEEQEQFEPVWIDSQDMKNLSPVSELAYILDWVENGDKSYTGEGVLINSGEFSDQLTMDSLPKMAEKFGKQKTTYKLRDWVFSRQRYWGEPIPLIHCEKDGVVPVPDDQLPVVLPEVKNYEPTGTGESPLAAIDEWVNTTCPECGGPAKRETNTMPQWAGSSWYFLRYTDPNNEQQFASSEKLKQWLPVDIYFGGMEHTTLHLLYSRFWNIFLHDQGLVPVSEPYTKRVPHGMILAEDGSKMSKSKGNVINPDDLVKQHGADTVRMYEMFLGPHEDSVLWSEKGIIGVARFLERIWNWINTAEFSEHDEETVSRELHKTIKKVTEDIEAYRFNTVVSNLMSFHNAVKDSPITKDSAKAFLQLLHPLAPHIASELYEQLGGENIDIQPWPKYDESMLVSDTITIAVQVNGKVRDELIVSTDSTQEEIETKALASEKVQALLSGQSPKRIIYVENRLVNIVV